MTTDHMAALTAATERYLVAQAATDAGHAAVAAAAKETVSLPAAEATPVVGSGNDQ